MRYQFNNWIFDLESFYLIYDGEPVYARRRTLALLRFLVMNPQRLLTRDEILFRVWQGKNVSDESLTTCVKELRKIFGDRSSKRRYIETRHGLGYRFLPKVIEKTDELQCP